MGLISILCCALKMRFGVSKLADVAKFSHAEYKSGRDTIDEIYLIFDTGYLIRSPKMELLTGIKNQQSPNLPLENNVVTSLVSIHHEQTTTIPVE